MNLVAVSSNKGGAGKTTTAVSLSAGLAKLYPVLLIDADPQGHVSLSFGLPVRSGLFDWLVRGLPLVDCTLTGRPDSLTILPGDSLTKTVERLFGDTSEFNRLVMRLRELVNRGEEVGNRRVSSGLSLAGRRPSPISSQPISYPFVVIDTAAGGVFQEAALAAADQVVIPFRCETLGLDSMYQTLELIRQLAPSAKVTLLPTAFDMRLREQRENLAAVVREFGEDYGLDHDHSNYVIRARVAVMEATRAGETIWEYNGSGIADVRRGYSLLVGRVLALAGVAIVEGEETEVHDGGN